MFDDVAVPDVQPGDVEFGLDTCDLSRISSYGVLVAGLIRTRRKSHSAQNQVSRREGTLVKVLTIDHLKPHQVQEWAFHNLTVDAHPIHVHLVQFQVVEREVVDTETSPHGDMGASAVLQPEPWEVGYKDTVIAYPGEITRIKARFDVAGLFVWHCHILEHEDNEMMRPYEVVK